MATMQVPEDEEASVSSCGGCDRLVQDWAASCTENVPPPHNSQILSSIHEKHPFYRTNGMSFAEELTILPPFSARDAMLPERTRDSDGKCVARINTYAARTASLASSDPSPLLAQSFQHGETGTRALHKPPADVADKLRRMKDMLRQEVSPDS